MATTNFVQFNPGAANQETDAQYLADAQRIAGYGTDQIVPSPLLNKATYQPTTFCAAFGQMLAAKGFTNSDASVSALAAVLANILTIADQLPNLISVSYSPTPSFNAAASNGFQMTLSGNITASTITGVSSGQLLAFYFVQDSAGSRTVNWPSGFTGTVQPDSAPNSVSVILFRADLGGTARAVSPLISNNGVFFGSPVAAPAGLTAPTVLSSDNSTNAATTAWAVLGFSLSYTIQTPNGIGGGIFTLPKWLGGFSIQWAQRTVQNYGTGTIITMPTPFANNCFASWATDSGYYTAVPYAVGCHPVSNTQISIAANENVVVTWFAIGN